MTTVRKIPVAEVELSVICANRCRAMIGPNATLDQVAAKTDDELKSLGFRRRDIREIREVASNLVEPPPEPADPRDAEIAALKRQRDDLLEANNRYLERARTAERLLNLFRAFAMRNATRWELGAGHHHPIWQAVAGAIPGSGDPAPGAEWMFIQPENDTPLGELERQQAALTGSREQ